VDAVAREKLKHYLYVILFAIGMCGLAFALAKTIHFIGDYIDERVLEKAESLKIETESELKRLKHCENELTSRNFEFRVKTCRFYVLGESEYWK